MKQAKRLPQDLIHYVGQVGFIRRPFWERYYFKGGTKRWIYKQWQQLLTWGYFLKHPLSHVTEFSTPGITMFGFCWKGGRSGAPAAFSGSTTKSSMAAS